ncbi:hypothetical protein MMC17_009619 [Xylographa soralifera]|nr:hypothetical protein [Xylographa soralifera]
MANPLSPLSSSGLNVKSPAKIALKTKLESTTRMASQDQTFDYGSENYFDHEHTRTMTSSPFIEDVDSLTRLPSHLESPSKHRSPKKPTPTRECGAQLTEDALRENEDLTGSVSTAVDRRTESYSEAGNENDTMSIINEPKSYAGADDTCFSTFSAVPNTDMTMFARIGQSPIKNSPASPTRSTRHRNGQRTPAHSRPTTPGTMRQRDYDSELPPSSPTPLHRYTNTADDTMNLLEFTGQLNDIAPSFRSPHHTSPRKPQMKHDFTGYPASHRLRSPTRDGFFPASPAEARHLTNLLDFDLPPAPTPRSIPTITARELESLKSSFNSQISSLKATLSGKEAEIMSLKGAKDDAEQRVGEALEQIRDLRDSNEDLQAEKGDWEKRDKEMQVVLRGVKEQIMCNEKEREELYTKTKDLERRCDEAETRASEAESKVAGLEAGNSAIASSQGEGNPGDISTPGSNSNKAVEVAVEKVARELHTLYKAKHETKVSALKKSYEARWEKRLRDLQARLDEVTRENDELRIGRDATMSGLVPPAIDTRSEPHSEPPSYNEIEEAQKLEDLQLLVDMKAQLESLAAEIDTLRRDYAALEAELEGVRRESTALQDELNISRRENSELVGAVEQMLSLEVVPASVSASQPASQPALPHATSSMGVAGEAGFKASVASRASGLKGPGFGTVGAGAADGRFGMGAMKRSASGGQGQGLGGPRSGIMSNIERMGRGRGVE